MTQQQLEVHLQERGPHSKHVHTDLMTLFGCHKQLFIMLRSAAGSIHCLHSSL
jgi:hypothetical protein